jgi:hypothetical protein
MQGEIRVTVVATGFAKTHSVAAPHAYGRASGGTPVIPIDGGRSRPVIGSAYSSAGSGGGAAPARRAAPQPAPERKPDIDDLEIPTFIRRQMD